MTDTKPVVRTPRDAETREQQARPVTWKPASALPDVTPRPGYTHKWVRKTFNGVHDSNNLSKKRREGWEPVKIEEYPELKEYVDPDARNSGLVEIGGLILHRLSAEMQKARQQYLSQRNRQDLQSAEAMYQSQAGAVSSMPIFKDNKSKTSFGSGE
jgi:hypothetical protein